MDWNALHGQAFKNQRVLVTGGAGFIGSHIIEALVSSRRLNKVDPVMLCSVVHKPDWE